MSFVLVMVIMNVAVLVVERLMGVLVVVTF